MSEFDDLSQKLTCFLLFNNFIAYFIFSSTRGVWLQRSLLREQHGVLAVQAPLWYASSAYFIIIRALFQRSFKILSSAFGQHERV